MKEVSAILYQLSERELHYAYMFSGHMEMGGTSHIFKGEQRQANLKDNQFTSQLGEIALSKFYTGGIDVYINNRRERDKNPWKGDDGNDLPGAEIPHDVKASRMRYGAHYPYNLWVRPKEYKPDTYYHLALVPKGINNIVYLIGWVEGRYMRLINDKYGERYGLRMDELNPMMAGLEYINFPNETTLKIRVK